MNTANVKGILEALVAAQIQKTVAGRIVRSGKGGIVGSLAGVVATRVGSAVAGVLVSMILGSKNGRALGGSLGRLGGLAAIGALAWQAYQEWQRGQTPQAKGPVQSPNRRVGALDADAATPGADPSLALPPTGSPLAPADAAQEEQLSRLLVRAMIGAAKADGRIDEKELAVIGGELTQMSLSEDDRAFVLRELESPLDIDAIARGALGDPQLGAAIYAASLLAITVDTQEERDYLAALAGKLGLDPGLVATLHRTVEDGAPVG